MTGWGAGTWDASPGEIRPNLIGGEWVGGDAVLDDVNPSDTDEVVARFARADRADAAAAVDAAAAAAPAWGRTPPEERAAVLDAVGAELGARQEELGRLLAREEGKTLAEAVGEVARAGRVFRFFAAEAVGPVGERWDGLAGPVEIETHRRPLGVVAVVTPWNFPVAIPAWKIAPALAFGNAVVLKPAELVPASAWALAEVAHRAGVPAGVLNLVVGPGGEVGEELVTSPGIDAVTFTGSTATGRRVVAAAAERLAPAQVEMGGKNPLVVLDDADLDVAVRCAVEGGWGSTGQRCTASSRLVVTAGIHDRFVEALTAAVAGLRVGHALDPATQIGPVIDERQLHSDLEHIAAARAEGADLACGGELLERERPGHYLSPALFVGTTPEMHINREEVFGPVASVIRVADDDEALAVANDTPYGLTAGVITTSLARARRFVRESATGLVAVNLPTAGVDHRVPFGGTKGSGFGPPEQGRAARQFFTRGVTSYVAPSA